MYVAFWGYTEIVRVLIAAYAQVDLQDIFGTTALIWATKRSHTEIIQALTAAGANVNLQNRMGETALKCAAMDNFTKMEVLILIVKTLVAAGADITVLTPEQRQKFAQAITDGLRERNARRAVAAGAQ